MKNFIETKLLDERSVCINISNITCFFPHEQGTVKVLFSSGEFIQIKLSYSEFQRKIQEAS